MGKLKMNAAPFLTLGAAFFSAEITDYSSEFTELRNKVIK